ncbi:MAG: glutathione peroxidase [Lachnospirales bacterium]
MEFYNFNVKDVAGNDVPLKNYEGKVVLVVNIATKCGLTPQLEGLEKLYKEYNSKGLEIIGFPCNQFLEQAPEDNKQINEFCSVNYGVTFKNFAKIDVNGETADPLYKFLKKAKTSDTPNEGTEDFINLLKNEYSQDFPGSEIKWNFGKFLIDRNGKVADRFSPTFTPDELKKEIEKYL